MTYTVSGGALNSTQTKLPPLSVQFFCSCIVFPLWHFHLVVLFGQLSRLRVVLKDCMSHIIQDAEVVVMLPRFEEF